ncbi:hypothetical protein [Algirhabdus cladophorae]|uniref:hypothetical protein n=1 Tax=Algirhabdus cladophorae TaxID=3377108 RepID=UPI003B847099
MFETSPTFDQKPVLGVIGFFVGAAAILLVLIHFWAGPFAPQQPAGVTLGELAGDIAKNAARKAIGLDPAEQDLIPQVWDIDRYLEIIAPILAGLAGIFGVAGLVCNEKWRFSGAAILFAVVAVVFQLFAFTILMLVGVLLIYAILSSLNLGSLVGLD